MADVDQDKSIIVNENQVHIKKNFLSNKNFY